jgi:DNA-binding response OmpR family regulator
MGRGHSVMLVEDEPMIALMVADMVEAQGYCVAGVFRANGEALAFLRTHRPYLAIVDFALRDGAAEPLAKKFKETGTPFCVISGYDRSVAGPLFDDVGWLDKPFSQDQLCSALRACVKERSRLDVHV